MEVIPGSSILIEVTAPGVAWGYYGIGIVRFTGIVHADVRVAVEIARVETADSGRAAFDSG